MSFLVVCEVFCTIYTVELLLVTLYTVTQAAWLRVSAGDCERGAAHASVALDELAGDVCPGLFPMGPLEGKGNCYYYKLSHHALSSQGQPLASCSKKG